ncbi:LysR family transcriptional regulator [Saccharopolyspora aridisoli]|uniref:LysR family transcriptional regulator n=1 Tax=Saccharopolyspora aridisoli TaxID=2530385 RepID=UPI001F43C111|nr:LysR family transcriptional regulator [Saccharopolyspora aridisoli]
MELRHLRALAAIGDEGTITGAAATLHVTQSALSRTLEQLESRIGTRLVERTTRRLVLTDAGGRLWERAHGLLNQLDEALAEASDGPRPLRVGFAWATLGSLTVPLLRSWRDEHPDTPVRVHRCDDPELALRRAEVDVAFLRTSPQAWPQFHAEPLFEEPRVAAVSEEDPLSRAPSLRLDDLADRTVALCATAATTNESLWPVNRRPQTAEVANVDEWLTLIATGDAVGVTADGTRHSHLYPGVRYLPISDAAPITVHLVRPRIQTHPEADTFLEFVQRAVGASDRSEAVG